MIRDKDLFTSGNDETVISADELAAVEGEKATEETKTDVMADAGTEVKSDVIDSTGVQTEAVIEWAQKTVEEWTQTPPEWTTTEETKAEKSISEILDEFEKLSTSQEQKSEEVIKTWEEVKKEAESKWQDTELIDKLNAQLLEIDTEKKKLSYTVDYLKSQLEDMTKENLSYKYGRVDEEGLLNLINSDGWIKNIISQTIKSQNWNPEDKEKLIETYKTQLETLTWLDFSEFISSSKKKIEEENVVGETDSATNVNMWGWWESLFL